MEVLTPIKSIRAKCLDCSNNQYSEVERCPIKQCALFPYRLGHRPGWEKKTKDNRVNIQEEEEN